MDKTNLPPFTVTVKYDAAEVVVSLYATDSLVALVYQYYLKSFGIGVNFREVTYLFEVQCSCNVMIPRVQQSVLRLFIWLLDSVYNRLCCM